MATKLVPRIFIGFRNSSCFHSNLGRCVRLVDTARTTVTCPIHSNSKRFQSNRQLIKRLDGEDEISAETDNLNAKQKLKSALEDLTSEISNSVWLLKITKCDADHSTSFSNAVCYVERSSEDIEKTDSHDVYDFAGIFAHGVTVLNNFLHNSIDLQISKAECIGIKRLTTFLQNIKDVEKRLSGDTKKEEDWSVQLVHHLLKDLAVNQRYIIDDSSKYQTDYCPCCREEVSGQCGDTSIGNVDYWHDSCDILMGHENMVVKLTSDPDMYSSDDYTSSMETKDSDDLMKERHQLISQAIVSACLQQQRNKDLEHFLIPTIGISKKDVRFYFYDPEHDILLESASYDLFVPGAVSPEIPYPTILALWLTINHRYFCTGITRAMKDRDYTADFFSYLPDHVKAIYKDNLRLGNCKSTPVEQYYRPRGSRWCLQKSEPFRKSKSLY